MRAGANIVTQRNNSTDANKRVSKEIEENLALSEKIRRFTVKSKFHRPG